MTDDLFGADPAKTRRKSKANGYAAPPGTGPADKRCKDCLHVFRKTYVAKPVFKCLLQRAIWGKTKTSDILARSPACNKFE